MTEGEALDRRALGALCSRTETLVLAGHLLDDDGYVAHPDAKDLRPLARRNREDTSTG